MPLNIHPKVSAAALTAFLIALVTFVTNGLSLNLDSAEWVLITGAISGLVGYLMPSGSWSPSTPAPKPPAG